MTRETPNAIILLMVLIIGPSFASADCIGSSLNPREVQRLVGATTLAELEAAWKALGHSNAALLAVYHRRRLEISPTPAEELRWLKG
jgi:hypothetical protein